MLDVFSSCAAIAVLIFLPVWIITRNDKRERRRIERKMRSYERDLKWSEYFNSQSNY